MLISDQPFTSRHRHGEKRRIAPCRGMALTDGRSVDVSIEALGTQGTFESCMRVLRPGGTLFSLGVYSDDLRISLDAFSVGLGDIDIVSSLCPGGQERMRRLMSVVDPAVST